MYPALNECSDEAYIQKAIHTNFEESQPQFPFEYALFHISSENDSYGQWNCQSFRRANFIIKPTCSTSHKECDSFMDVVRNINAPVCCFRIPFILLLYVTMHCFEYFSTLIARAT